MTGKTKIICCILALQFACWSQTPTVGKFERCWAFWHPVSAIRVKRITHECDLYSNRVSLITELDRFKNGGRLDAYRHSFYMAAYSQKIKVRKLRKLGIAHEKTNYRQFLRSASEEGELPDSLGTVMDLFNNELGFKIGTENKNKSLEQLSELLVQEIKKGNARIMKRDDEGRYLDCEGNVIDLNEYRKTWNIPKCLVSSQSY